MKKLPNSHLGQSGFTMIEILIVVIIIGILATLGTLSFIPSLEKSRDGRRKADLVNISKALEAYNTDHGSYPSSSATGLIEGCVLSGSTVGCEWGEAFTDAKGSVYMATLPEDPRAFEYTYLAATDGAWYVLLARLENEQDPVWPILETTPPARGVFTHSNPDLSNTACGGDGCSYVQYGPSERPNLGIEDDDSETGIVPAT